MSDIALRIRGLKKRFGKTEALSGLDLTIPRNSVTALIGANGAGKTTTFSIIGQFIKPDSGTIEVGDLTLAEFRRVGGIIGILPQDVLFFEGRSVAQHLILFAKLAGLRGVEAENEVARVLALVSLTEKQNSHVAELSHGMRVRLGVAQALVGKPSIVLLDEPTAGLDPKMVASFRDSIDQLRGSCTIVISSHDLSELQMMCDYVCMIDQGKLVRQGLLSDLLLQSSRVTFRLESGEFDFEALCQSFPEFKFELKAPLTLLAEFDRALFQVTEVNSRILFWLFRHRIGVYSVESQRSLEQTFLEALPTHE